MANDQIFGTEFKNIIFRILFRRNNMDDRMYMGCGTVGLKAKKTS